MPTCDTCKYWKASYLKKGKMCCDFIDTISAEKPPSNVELEATASDDSGLMAELVTGPKFGCVHHQSKLNTNETE